MLSTKGEFAMGKGIGRTGTALVVSRSKVSDSRGQSIGCCWGAYADVAVLKRLPLASSDTKARFPAEAASPNDADKT